MQYRFTLLFCLLTVVVRAQISEGGQPFSLIPENAALFAANRPVSVELPAPDMERIRQEDDAQSILARFAAPVAADITPATAGQWTDLPGGARVWRCQVQAPGALGLILLFDQFRLPEGARFFAYSADLKRIRGAYTSKSCIPAGKFTIGVLPGETAVMELYEPAQVAGQSLIHLNRVDYAYQQALLAEGDPAFSLDFGESLPCNINVNCPVGAEWQSEKKGIARALMVYDQGSLWCSGSLVANTQGTGVPYFLSAHHCTQFNIGTAYFDQWVFDFEYEAPTCSNPVFEPLPKSILGCERMSFRLETDFMLLKLNPIPASYGVYFNGWTRQNSGPTTSAFIHHPKGDIKKISVSNQPSSIFGQQINWGGQFGISQPNTHWKVVPTQGIFQSGSSGCPVLSSDKKIFGQLHGGSISQVDPCVINAAYFGRFDLSWDQGGSAGERLKEWLDPGNTNAMSQNGYAQPIPPSFSISGNIQTHWGAAMPGVQVVLSGGASDTTFTDFGGNYAFQNLPSNEVYNITPSYDSSLLNGVTTFDMVLISKNILGLDTLDSPYKLISADVNGSNSVTTFDIVDIRKVVLGINSQFPNGMRSWRFIPSSHFFSNPLEPFLPQIPAYIQTPPLLQNITDANFKGLKIGDTNNSAVPGQ